MVFANAGSSTTALAASWICFTISVDIAHAVKSSNLTDRMKQQRMEPVGSMPEEFDALISSEIDKWAKVVKLSGAKVD